MDQQALLNGKEDLGPQMGRARVEEAEAVHKERRQRKPVSHGDQRAV